MTKNKKQKIGIKFALKQLKNIRLFSIKMSLNKQYTLIHLLAYCNVTNLLSRLRVLVGLQSFRYFQQFQQYKTSRDLIP